MCISYSPLFCYCIGYTSDNDWSTSVIPLDQYQDQLRRTLIDWENFRLHLQQKDKEQQQLLQEKATLTQQLDDATTLLQQAEKDKSSLELGTIVLYCCLCVHCYIIILVDYTMLSMEIVSCTQYRSNCPCITNNEIHVE